MFMSEVIIYPETHHRVTAKLVESRVDGMCAPTIVPGVWKKLY